MYLITPIRTFPVWIAWLAALLIADGPLSRFDPCVTTADGNNFIKFNTLTSDGLYVNLGKPNTNLSAHIKADVFDAIASVARLGSTTLVRSTVESWCGDKIGSAVLTEYHRSSSTKLSPTVFPVSLGVRAYDFKTVNNFGPTRPKLCAFMSPMLHKAYVPVPNKASEEQCVKGRINSLKKEEPQMNGFVSTCMREFADFVVSGASLQPVDYDYVYNKQCTATQRKSLMNADATGFIRKHILKCFLKAEAYTGIKDPRNISTYNDASKLDMSRFTLSLSQHCKQFSWYGPGKTPKELAHRVSEICTNALFVDVSDYHRMDGTITYLLRQVERLILMSAFKDHRTFLNELLKTNAGNPGYLPLGTSFDQDSSHGSGCAGTSLFQTLRATFTSYLAFRHSVNLKTQRTYTPSEAFYSLGVHVGDDGLDADLPIPSHIWAAKKVGLVLEGYTIVRGDRGVTFLARYYSPNVWYGCPDSMCDPLRQLSKFHTTIGLPANITPEAKLFEKSMSYAATDSNTPVIGEFVNRALDFTNFRPKKLFGLGNYWTRFDPEHQFPNDNADNWMDHEFEILVPGFDRQLFNKWLAGITKYAELLSPPLFEEIEEPTSKIDVIVGDTIIKGSDQSSRTDTSEEKWNKIRPDGNARNRRINKFKLVLKPKTNEDKQSPERPQSRSRSMNAKLPQT